MASGILSRYIDPEVLNRIAHQKFEPHSLVSGNLSGSHKSPTSGFAIEFIGHREYVPGDDPKHIDWRVFFNRDRYVIKQYEMETNLVCHLLLDISASMRYGEGEQQKLAFAAAAAVTMGYLIVRQSDKVSMSTYDDEVRNHISPRNSMQQIVRITQQLDHIQAVEKTNMAPCLFELAGRMKRREIVMIFSDFFTDLEELESALQHLRYQKHEVVLFHVLHHDELVFGFEGMVKFIGLETDDQYFTRCEDYRKSYLEALNQYTEQLKEICFKNQIEYVLSDTSVQMSELLVNYLNQRNKVRLMR